MRCVCWSGIWPHSSHRLLSPSSCSCESLWMEQKRGLINVNPRRKWFVILASGCHKFSNWRFFFAMLQMFSMAISINNHGNYRMLSNRGIFVWHIQIFGGHILCSNSMLIQVFLWLERDMVFEGGVGETSKSKWMGSALNTIKLWLYSIWDLSNKY